MRAPTPRRGVVDITGRRFGRWTVIVWHRGSYWLCRCDCGTERSVLGTMLRAGKSKSCGCLQSENLSGKRFGRWRVLRLCPWDTHRHDAYWLCRCACGTKRNVRGHALRTGRSKSCGCAKTTHGMSRTPIYAIWVAMKQRCLNPNNEWYRDYGGRGIAIDDSNWLSFQGFYADVGDRPHEGLSLDRVDNNAGYGPTNYRWATPTEQARNQRPRKRKKRKARKLP